jgi:UDP-N-acetyl-D-mannosaminuronic acid dehydrogenase
LKIAVIGLGYVGLPLSSLLARNFKVIGFDVDRTKIIKINSGSTPINEPGLYELLSSALKSGSLIVTDNAALINEARIKIITVGTPYDENSDFVDYSQLEDSLKVILPNLNHGDVVMLKSTVPPGTTMGLVKNRIESAGFDVPEDIGLVFSPERMIEGQAVQDFQVLPKIIGASDARSANIAEEILRTLGGKIIKVSKPETAETIKMVDNYSRYVFIGLANELAIVSEKIGVDVLEVIGSAKDEYPRNAGLLLPGPGVGGSCLNKDPFILRGVVRRYGIDMQMVKSAEMVNSRMPVHIVEMVTNFRKSGSVAILGVAFKGDTDDTRYTPSFKIKEGLIEKKYKVILTDPYVAGEGIHKDFYEACRESNILVLLTDHSEYRKIDLQRLRSIMGSDPLIIDSRGLIPRENAVENGFEYHGVGRL